MKKKKILAVSLMAAMAASSISACSSKSSDPGQQNAPEASSASSQEAQAQSQSSNSPAPADGAGETGNGGGYANLPKSDVIDGETDQQTYPISDEKITLTMWYPMGSSMGELADFNDGEFWQWYKEKTNIHIEFIVPAAGTEKDSYQLLFASGDMPDLIYSNPDSYGSYRSGEDAAIEDGYFVNIADYLNIAPNYVSWLNSHEDFGKASYTDTGKMYAMWCVWDTMEEDAYADQGIAKGEFMAGFDTAPYFYQRDGKVQFGPMDDQYKEYLEMLHRWWEEGLLDPDFATRSSEGITADNDMMLNDKVGSLIDYGTRMSDAYVTRGATNSEFYLVAAPQPKKSADSPDPAWRYYSKGSDHMTSDCINVNADSDHIEEAIRWLDGLYAKDVYLNANYGLEDQEGIVWYKADDGHRIGDYDFRYSNPNGTSSATVLVQYWTKNPPVRVEAAQIEQADENKQESYKVWSKFSPDYYLPNRLTMTSDEGAAYASKYTDIETYVYDAAKIDGAGNFRILWQVVVPVSKSIIAVIVLFYAIQHWNSWFNASIYLRNRELYPLQLTLREIVLLASENGIIAEADGQDVEIYRPLIKYATIMVSVLPMMVVYPFVQKYFVSGVMIGSVKG